jgi:hypothetical protein
MKTRPGCLLPCKTESLERMAETAQPLDAAKLSKITAPLGKMGGKAADAVDWVGMVEQRFDSRGLQANQRFDWPKGRFMIDQAFVLGSLARRQQQMLRLRCDSC